MPLDLGYVSTTLKGAAQHMSDEDRLVALDCYRHYQRECERLAPDNALNVAHTIHALIDERVQRLLTTPNGRAVTCGKGCAACCHVRVHVNSREAELLLAYAVEQGVDIDLAKLQRQADKGDATWHELSIEDRRCVFLGEDRTCRVYEHRPGACRKYHVLTDPDLCDMDKYPRGKVGIVFDTEAEIIHSAAMTVFGAGSMAAMLLRTREQK